jgi:hypothetical protein
VLRLGEESQSTGRGLVIFLAILVIVPLLVIGVVGVRTWMPLQQASRSLEELQLALGPRASYTPTLSGEIPAERMELFLELRATLVTACENYGTVQGAFEAVASMDSSQAEAGEVGETALLLGSAALSITPFLARYFELRNNALLAATMGLEEYAYIYAVAYREQLLSERTRAQIFSGGEALSPEASTMLRGCLARQVEAMGPGDGETSEREAVKAELQRMQADPTRLIWQDGLPPAAKASVTPYRESLDRLFCGATAGLELEQGARRALRLALE